MCGGGKSRPAPVETRPTYSYVPQPVQLPTAQRDTALAAKAQEGMTPASASYGSELAGGK